MEWLQANWLPLTIVVGVVVIFIGYIIYLCKKTGLRKVALDAILKAEEQYHSTTGQERLQLAVDYVYEQLPALLRIAFTKDIIKKYLANFVQKVFDEVKELLDYQVPELKEGEV